ncbi:MAG: hypothetical protein Q9182_000833 [Xanthomendoza sp. 2 TL-2023]
MRLFLLPISTRRSLIYCQRLNNQLSSETTYVDKLTTRASNTWLNWEKAKKGWQKSVTQYGNKLFERIPHEEWGLKSIPPLSQRRKHDELKRGKEVEVVYPASAIDEENVKSALKAFAGDERQAFHRKWMWWTRSGSQHVEFLLNNRLLKFTASPRLDMVYTSSEFKVIMENRDSGVEKVLEKPADVSSEPNTSKDCEKILLTQSSGSFIALLAEVPELEEHVQRAVMQVEKSLRARKELQEEKQDLDSVMKQADPKQ